MNPHDPNHALHVAKKTIRDNLKEILAILDACVNAGMTDEKARYHNAFLPLLDEAKIARNWDEIDELVAKAKTLEKDLAVWLSARGKTTLSYPWPRRP